MDAGSWIKLAGALAIGIPVGVVIVMNVLRIKGWIHGR